MFPEKRPLFWPECPITPGTRAVVLAPHPDDFDAVAVTLMHFLAAGGDLRVAVLTAGASGVHDMPDAPTSQGAKAALRETEQRASCDAFGLAPEALRFLRLAEDHDGHLLATAAAREAIAGVLRELEPALVFMPHGNDTNPTHQRVHALFAEIAATLPWPLTALLNRDPKTVTMRHDLFTVFGAQEAAWKGQLLRLHASQHQRNLRTRGHGFDERILAMNRETARRELDGADYAEVFEIWNVRRDT